MKFTLEAVDWSAWMPVVTAEAASPRQLAALEASPQRDSEYFRTLAHDVDSLEQRSPLFHAVMYAPRGLPRADRELATVVVSIINGCVYCSSVHARRFSELTKKPEIIQRLYDEGLSTKLEPRQRAIVDFAAKLTREPQRVSRDDIKPLRDVGMDELQTHDLIHAIAMFANANRLMQTLGEPTPVTASEAKVSAA